METVRLKNGCVVGFDKLNIDPMATKQRVLAELESSGLVRAIEDAQAAVKQAVTIIPNAKEGATIRYSPEYPQLVATHRDAVAQYNAEHTRLTSALVMYFQPRRGEVVVDADSLARFKVAWGSLGPGQKLTMEGEVIDVERHEGLDRVE